VSAPSARLATIAPFWVNQPSKRPILAILASSATVVPTDPNPLTLRPAISALQVPTVMLQVSTTVPLVTSASSRAPMPPLLARLVKRATTALVHLPVLSLAQLATSVPKDLLFTIRPPRSHQQVLTTLLVKKKP
jgi:hypothetical protein